MKKTILNVYNSPATARLAFKDFCSELNENAHISHGNLIVETKEHIHKFSFFVDYESAKQRDIFGMCYYAINFHVELPEDIKGHYLSRIR